MAHLVSLFFFFVIFDRIVYAFSCMISFLIEMNCSVGQLSCLRQYFGSYSIAISHWRHRLRGFKIQIIDGALEDLIHTLSCTTNYIQDSVKTQLTFFLFLRTFQQPPFPLLPSCPFSSSSLKRSRSSSSSSSAGASQKNQMNHNDQIRWITATIVYSSQKLRYLYKVYILQFDNVCTATNVAILANIKFSM